MAQKMNRVLRAGPLMGDEVSSVPRCRFASDGISASLQQVLVFLLS